MAEKTQVQIKQAMSEWNEEKSKPKPKQKIRREGDDIWIEEEK